jgi:hypothetical protein
MHFRVHVLQRVRGNNASWRLPELPGRIGGTSEAAVRKARQISGLDETYLQARGVRAGFLIRFASMIR